MKDKRTYFKVYTDQKYIDKIKKKSKKIYGKENVSQYIKDLIDDTADTPGKRKKRSRKIVEITENLNQLFLKCKDVNERNNMIKIIKEVSELWDC